jgi:hypothetical protein
MFFIRRALKLLCLSSVCWTSLPLAALELSDVAREGELRFLAVRPDPGA